MTSIELELQAQFVENFHTYETGRVVAKLALREGVEVPNLLKSFGLENCGIGGFHCSCNEGKLGKDIDTWDFVQGALKAQRGEKAKAEYNYE